MRLEIHTVGREFDSVELGPEESVLIGREPDAEALSSRRPSELPPGEVEAPAESTRVLALGRSASVSANHLYIERRGDRAHLVDLGSRNGSWLKLPAGSQVEMAAPSQLSVRLALPLDNDAPSATLEPASYLGPEDYALGVSVAVERWLRQMDLPARVVVVAHEGTGDHRAVGRLSLATREDLLLVPQSTVEAHWIDAVAQLERYASEQNRLFLAQQELREAGLIVVSEAMRKTVARVVNAAASGAKSLLLLGASGSGKEGLARCFHRNTGRPGAFVAKNCAVFSHELARSELFGAERGSFTGSVQRIVGAIEAAHEGTIFLDEIGELPPTVQPMLLRFLDHGEFDRLGHRGEPSKADVRIVGATNKDIRSAAMNGEFRTDLWFRLSAHVVRVPGLSERFEDVAAYLQERPLTSARSVYEELTAGALDVLREHAWEGNFRELRNFSDRLASEPPPGRIDADLCRHVLEEGALQPSRKTPPARSQSGGPLSAPEDWGRLAELAAQAFADDHSQALPTTWDEVKQYVESYLKPLLLTGLGGVHELSTRSDVDLRTVAERLRADRGTASKQVERYFDRFVDPARSRG